MTRKLILLLSGLLMTAPQLHAQLGISYHQSALPFAGINLEIGRHLLTEVRIATDIYLGDLAGGAIVAYKFGRNEDIDPYLGAGIRLAPEGEISGITIPLGANIYPFTSKKFGFHIELAPLIIGEGTSLLLGSWGIRYRFRKQ